MFFGDAMLLCGKEKFRDGKDDHPYECSENGGMRKGKKRRTRTGREPHVSFPYIFLNK